MKQIWHKTAALSLALLAIFGLFGTAISAAPEQAPHAGERMLLAGGMNFGVEFTTDGVLVVSVGDPKQKEKESSPAYRAGVRTGDLIRKVNGKKVTKAEEITEAVRLSEGAPVKLSCLRKGEQKEFTVTPKKAGDGSYKIGIFLRDKSAGIGTVTFIDPDTLAFGGLGHGITAPDNGGIFPVTGGIVTDAHISGVRRGESGSPGEMQGALGREKRGILLSNCETGVYGVFRSLPKGGRLLPIGRAEELSVGPATILSTLDTGEVTEYTVNITEVDRENRTTKCFMLEVTDKRLLEKSGGIVQGMSGSPVLQNGKLCGAVTHVLIKDPRRGYGIFIENMLASAPEVVQ